LLRRCIVLGEWSKPRNKDEERWVNEASERGSLVHAAAAARLVPLLVVSSIGFRIVNADIWDARALGLFWLAMLGLAEVLLLVQWDRFRRHLREIRQK